MLLFDNNTGGYIDYIGSTTLLNGVAYNAIIEYDGMGTMAMSLNGNTEIVSKSIVGTYNQMRNTASKFKIGGVAWSTLNKLRLDQDLENLKIYKY